MSHKKLSLCRCSLSPPWPLERQRRRLRNDEGKMCKKNCEKKRNEGNKNFSPVKLNEMLTAVFLKNFHILMFRITNFTSISKRVGISIHCEQQWGYRTIVPGSNWNSFSVDFSSFFTYPTPVSTNTPGWLSISIEVEKFHFCQFWTKSFPSYSE